MVANHCRYDGKVVANRQNALSANRIRDGVRKVLIALGLRVQFKLEVSKRPRADRVEVQALMADLSKLESLPRSEELLVDQGGTPILWNAKGVRGYLADDRILFFHDVIAAARGSGVEFLDKNVADVGSGTGYLLRLIASHNPARLVGYDMYTALNIVASVLCPSAEIVTHDLFKQPLETHDVVFCMETLEHQIDPALAVRQLMKYVKPGGTLVLTVPDGRKDASESGPEYPGGTGYYGHINFWGIESFGYFISTTLGSGFRVDTMLVGNESPNLMAIVTERG